MKTTTDVSNRHHSQHSHSAHPQIKLRTLLPHQLARSFVIYKPGASLHVSLVLHNSFIAGRLHAGNRVVNKLQAASIFNYFNGNSNVRPMLPRNLSGG